MRRQFIDEATGQRHISGYRNRTTGSAVMFAFILGLSTAVSVKAGATILAADVVVLISFPFAVYAWAQAPRKLAKPSRIAIILSAIWLIASIASNIYNHTSLFNWVRGEALIVVFIAALLVMGVFVAGHTKRERWFLVGLALGVVGAYLVHPTFAQFRSTWKFQIGVPIALATASLFDRPYWISPLRLLLQCAVLFALGLFSLSEGYRSLSGFLILTSGIGLYKAVKIAGAKGRWSYIFPRSLSFTRFAASGLVVFFFVGATILLYGAAVNNGWLGRQGTERVTHMRAIGYGPILDTLIGSRPQILISSYAVSKKPLLGYGAWPQDCEFIRKFRSREEKAGIALPVGLEFTHRHTGTPCLIPTHSHVFDAWVRSGVFGIFGWLFIWGCIAWWVARAAGDKYYVELAPIIMAATVLWAIPFSSFAGPERITQAFIVTVIFSRWGLIRRKA